jgi:cation transport ATPase
MTVNTRVLQLFMHARPEEHYIQIHSSLRLQVIPSIEALAHCQRHQSAAFIASSATLIVWEDEPARLLERAEYIQDALMKMSWKSDDVEDEVNEKGDGKRPFVEIEEYAQATHEEEAGEAEKPRATMLWQSIYTAITMAAVITALGSGWRLVAIEQSQDLQWIRLAFIVAVPAQLWLGLVSLIPLAGSIRLT